jgi:hypothetical protein
MDASLKVNVCKNLHNKDVLFLLQKIRNPSQTNKNIQNPDHLSTTYFLGLLIPDQT